MMTGQNGNRRRSSRHSKSNEPSFIEVQNTAWKWWNKHLVSSGWIRFKPEEKYCHADGFIPVQYRSKEAGNNVRTIKKYVITHGERGVHYVMGWHELYHMVHKFGMLTPGPQGFPTILNYEGPPLLVGEEKTVEPTHNGDANEAAIKNHAENTVHDVAVSQNVVNMNNKDNPSENENVEEESHQNNNTHSSTNQETPLINTGTACLRSDSTPTESRSDKQSSTNEENPHLDSGTACLRPDSTSTGIHTLRFALIVNGKRKKKRLIASVPALTTAPKISGVITDCPPDGKATESKLLLSSKHKIQGGRSLKHIIFSRREDKAQPGTSQTTAQVGGQKSGEDDSGSSKENLDSNDHNRQSKCTSSQTNSSEQTPAEDSTSPEVNTEKTRTILAGTEKPSMKRFYGTEHRTAGHSLSDRSSKQHIRPIKRTRKDEKGRARKRHRVMSECNNDNPVVAPTRIMQHDNQSSSRASTIPTQEITDIQVPSGVEESQVPTMNNCPRQDEYGGRNTLDESAITNGVSPNLLDRLSEYREPPSRTELAIDFSLEKKRKALEPRNIVLDNDQNSFDKSNTPEGGQSVASSPTRTEIPAAFSQSIETTSPPAEEEVVEDLEQLAMHACMAGFWASFYGNA